MDGLWIQYLLYLLFSLTLKLKFRQLEWKLHIKLAILRVVANLCAPPQAANTAGAEAGQGAGQS